MRIVDLDPSNGDFPTLKPFLPNSPLTRESFEPENLDAENDRRDRAGDGAPAVHRVVRGAWLSVAVTVRRIRARNTGAHIVVDELHITGSERTTMDISPIALNHSQRRAIGFLASEYGRSLITMPYVGPKTIDALIKLGLIEIALHNLHGEPRYGLTKAGNNMHEELSRLMLIPR